MSAMFTTPGPWHADGWLIEDESHNPKTVATTAARGERGKADAKLIAAAPDLYEALCDLRDLRRHGDTEMVEAAWRRAADAIAKAEGRARLKDAP